MAKQLKKPSGASTGWLNKYDTGGEHPEDDPITEYIKKYKYRGPTYFKECYGEGCAKIAGKTAANLTGISYEQAVPQDAWYKRDAIIKAGGKEVYNHRDSLPPQDISRRTRLGDQVTFNRPGGRHNSASKGDTSLENEGTAHAGTIVGYDDRGVAMVRHGHSGGVSVVNPIDSVRFNKNGTQYTPSSILRVKDLLDGPKTVNEKYVRTLDKSIPLQFTADAQMVGDKEKFVNAYNQNSNDFQLESGLSAEDVNAIGRIAYGVLGNESNFNQEVGRNLFRKPKQLVAQVLHAVGLKDTAPSLGPTQLKYDSAVKNTDGTKTTAGKMLDQLGVESSGLKAYPVRDWQRGQLYKGEDYNHVTRATFGVLADNLRRMKSNPKFQFDPATNTVLGNVPIGYALAKSWNHPHMNAKTRKSLKDEDSDYAKKVYENMSDLETGTFRGKLSEVVVTPEKKTGGQVGWLNKYEEGGETDGPFNMRAMLNNSQDTRQDNTKVVPVKAMSNSAAAYIKKQKDAAELARRKKAIADSNAAQAKAGALGITKETLRNSAIGDKARVFPNDPDSFIDTVNPAVWIGSMADRLGKARADGTIGEQALAIAEPVAFGAMAGVGAKTAGQFANNLVNPLAGINPNKIPIVNQVHKLNPNAFKINPEAFYRGVGKDGMNDIMESGIIKSKKVHAYPEPYFSKGKIGDKYASGYFAELTNEPMKGVGSFSTGDLIQTPVSQVNINNPNLKLYQKDWLQGYKEIKPTSNKVEYKTNFLSESKKNTQNRFKDEQVLPEHIDDVVQQELKYLESPEYMTNRMKNTGESEATILKEINKYKENLERGNININPNTSGGDASLEGYMNPFMMGKRKALINVGSKAGKNDAIGTAHHEVNHVLSPAVTNAFGTPKEYKNFPTIDFDPFYSVGGKRYNMLPYEQQVRFNKLKMFMEDTQGIKRGTPFSQEDVETLINTLPYNVPGKYEDAVNFVKDISQQDGWGSKLQNALNNSWGLAPVALGATTLNQKKKTGGQVNWLDKYQ